MLLEKMARLVVHKFDLNGDITASDIHNLARISKKLEADYEEGAAH